MTHLPSISALTPEQLNEYKSRVAAWLASDQSDLTEGITLCTAIPQAAIFISYHKAYTPCTRRKHIVQFLSTIDTTPVEPPVETADSTEDGVSTPTSSTSDMDADAATTDEDGVSTPSSSTDSENSEDTPETKKRR